MSKTFITKEELGSSKLESELVNVGDSTSEILKTVTTQYQVQSVNLRQNNFQYAGNDSIGLSIAYSTRDICHVERRIYNKPQSLDAVPVFACPFQECRKRYENVLSLKSYNDEYNSCRLTKAGMSYICLKEGKNPMQYPNMEDFIQRMASFLCCSKFEHWSMDKISTLAAAGFFSQDDDGMVRCFNCPLQLRELDSNLDPFREHARWFPSCSFIQALKGNLFVHHVLEDTIKLQQENDMKLTCQFERNKKTWTDKH